MNTRSLHHYFRHCWLILVLAAWPAVASAQLAVAEIQEIEEFPIASATELEKLVGPIALYPDDLLAIVLPASTFPLQIVEASRFLQNLEDDPSLKPDDDWDDSVVALLNYPEVIELLNEDLDWTWRLGEVVVAQQSDVISAIELFRDRAYAAGNLKSDDYQLVAHEDSSIQITPVQEDVIYVPYYEPERVVVYQTRPAYYYYPRPYPVYYYPYSAGYAFHDDFFWGVTTAFSIGWHSHHLNVFHHSFYGHPYYGHSYGHRYWYRRPDIHVHNNVYVRNNTNVPYNRYQRGDRWQANERRTVRSSDQRVTRTRFYPNTGSSSSSQPSRNANSFASRNTSGQVARSRNSHREVARDNPQEPRPDIQFRDREATASRTTTARPSSRARQRQVRQEPSRQSQARQEPSPQQRQSQPKASSSRQSQPRQSQRSSSPSRSSKQVSRSSRSRSSN